MWPNPQETADLVTFTEEILNGKLHFLCSVICNNSNNNRKKTMLTNSLSVCNLQKVMSAETVSYIGINEY